MTMTIQKGFTLINLLFITIAVYLCVNIFYKNLSVQLYGPKRVQQVVTGKVIPSPTESVLPERHYKAIMDRNLFKSADIEKASTPSAPEPVDLNSLAETKLDLKLWGTVAGDDHRAFAVIQEKRANEQNLYRIGDSIQNATIKAILREKVILSLNGRDEVLLMEEIKGSGPSSLASRRNGSTSRALPSTISEPAASSSSRPARTQKISLRRSLIENSVKDISKLMTEIQISPNVENGNPSGLSISNIRPNSIFRRMGLRNGDVITGVDDQSIQSVDDALKLYENLKSASSMKLQIKRRGIERTIEYNIQ